MIDLYLSQDVKDNKVLFKMMRDNIEKHKTGYYFVPDQYTLYSDINILNELNLDIIMDIKVKSFSSFSDEILSSHGGIKKNLITEAGKNMVLQKILIENRDEFIIFDKNIRSKGFISKLSQTISEIKEAGISPEKFKSTIQETSKRSRQKLNELAFVYEKYEEEMEGMYIDGEDRLGLLNEKLAGAKELAGVDFYFDKFNYLNLQELAIVEKLNELGAKINFFLLLDPDMVKQERPEMVDNYELFQSSFTLYKKLADIAGDDLSVHYLKSREKSTKEFLADNIFSYNEKSSSVKPEDIAIMTGQRTQQEVDFVCETIKRLVIEEGYRYKDFAIITSSEDEYDPYIKNIFSSEGIPYFLDRKKNLLDNKLILFLVNIFLLMAEDLKAQDVTSFLKFVLKEDLREKVEVFEKYIFSRKIRANMYYDDKYFTLDDDYLANLDKKQLENEIQRLNTVQEIRSIFLDLIDDYYHKAREIKIIDEHIKDFFNFIHSEVILDSISSFISSQEQDEALDSTNRQSWDYFIEIIDQLSQISGKRKSTYKDFASILIAGFEKQSIGIIPPSQDNVFVGSLKRTRSNNNKQVFILGLNENYFPSQLKDRSLIDEDKKKELNSKGLEFTIKTDLYKNEEYLGLYSFIQSAEDKLYILSSLSDSSNKQLSKSFYFLQVEKIFPNIERTDPVKFLNDIKYSKNLLVKDMYRSLSRAGDSTKKMEKKSINLFSYLLERKSKTLDPVLMSLSPRLKKLDPQVRDKLYSSKKVSISRLESYARCPYRHYVSYGLKAKENKDFDIEYREIGSLAHKTLAKFIDEYKYRKEDIDGLSDREFRQYIASMVEEDAGSLIDETRLDNGKNKLILKIAKDNISTGIANVKRQLNLSSFRPRSQETRFAEGHRVPALKIEAAGKVIDLEGIIDRVDEYENDKKNIIVIDYKTGSKSFNLSFTLAGIDIQLPIYLAAVKNADKDSLAVGFFYLAVKDEFIDTESLDTEDVLESLIKKLALDGVVIKDEEILKALDINIASKPTVLKFAGRKRNVLDKENVLDQEDFDRLVEDVLERTKNQVEGIYSGDISTYPYIYQGTSQCNYCQYGDICKFDLDKNKSYRPIKNITWKDYTDD